MQAHLDLPLVRLSDSRPGSPTNQMPAFGPSQPHRAADLTEGKCRVQIHSPALFLSFLKTGRDPSWNKPLRLLWASPPLSLVWVPGFQVCITQPGRNPAKSLYGEPPLSVSDRLAAFSKNLSSQFSENPEFPSTTPILLLTFFMPSSFTVTLTP